MEDINVGPVRLRDITRLSSVGPAPAEGSRR